MVASGADRPKGGECGESMGTDASNRESSSCGSRHRWVHAASNVSSRLFDWRENLCGLKGAPVDLAHEAGCPLFDLCREACNCLQQVDL